MAIENVGLLAVTEKGSQKVAVKAGGKIKAQAGTKYLLQTEHGEVAPENITVKRVGNDMHLSYEGSDQADLIVQDFYAAGMEGELYGVAEDGQLYAFVRTDGSGFGNGLVMADGETAPLALGGEGVPYTATPLAAAAGFALWPLLLGLAAAGAAAAIIHHNRDSGGHHNDTSPAPTNIKVTDNVGPIQGPISNGGVTDDAHAAISGNGVPGAIIHVIDNGKEIGSTTVAPDGTWTYTPEAALADGAHSIDITQNVPGSDPSEQVKVIDFTVDTVPPAAPTAEIDGAKTAGDKTYVPDNTPSIHGDGEPGDKIIIVFPTGESVTTTVADDGTWVAPKPTEPLPEGDNDIKVIEQDPAGNETEITVPVIIDTIAPTAPEVHLDPASDSGVKGDDITNVVKPTIDGKTEPGAEITVTFPTGETVTTTADAAGDWSVTPTLPLPDGNNEISVIATDPAGHASEPTKIVVVIDTKAPDAPEAHLDPESDSGVKGDDITSVTKPTIDGKTEPNATITVTFPTGETVTTTADAKGDWAVTPTQDLPEGKNDITIIATDAADNKSEPTTISVVIDTKAPPADAHLDPASDSGIKGDGLTNDTLPQIDGKTEPNSVVEVTFPTGETVTTTADAKGDWSVKPTKPLPDGKNDISVVVTDPAHNKSEPKVLPIVIDTKVPSADAWLDPASDSGIKGDGITNETKPQIDGKTKPNAEVTVTFPTGETVTTTADAKGDWSVKPTTPLPDGKNDISVVVTDQAANKSEPKVLPIHIDTVAPVAPHIDHVIDNVGDVTGEIRSGVPTDDRKPVVSGTSGEAGLTIVVYNIVDGGKVEIGRTTSDAKGDWTLSSDQYKAPLAGDVKLVAEAIDPATNQSKPSNERDFTVLTTPPASPVIKEVWNDDVTPHLNVQPDGYTNDNTALIKGTAEPGSRVKVYNDEDLIGTAITDDKGQWQLNLPEGSEDGEYNIYAVAVNAASMESAKAGPYHFIVDTTFPEALTPSQWEIIDKAGDHTGPVHNGDTIDDAAPTVRNAEGEKLHPDFVVTVYDGDKAIGSTIVKDDGSWSVDVPAPNGTHDFSVTVINLADNESDKSNHINFTTDISPNEPAITGVFNDDGPALIPVERGGHTNDATPQVHGTAKAGSLVEVYDNKDTPVGSTTAGSDGKWSLDVSTLSEGDHTLTVRAKEPAENWSGKVSDYTIHVDVTAPTKPTIDYVEDTVGDFQGPVLDNGHTDDPNPVFHGKGEAGTIVHLFEEHNGHARVEIGSTVVDKDGNWKIKPTDAYSLIGNPETAYTFTADSYDKAKNHSASDPFHLNVDFVPPPAPTITGVVNNDDLTHLIDVPKGGSTNDTTPVISGGGAKKGDVIHVFDGDKELGTTTVTKADGTWSFEVPAAKALKDGEHDFTAKAQDQAGHTSEPSQPYPVHIDTDGPNANTTKLLIDTVTDDNVINISEAAGDVKVSGKVTGEFTAGDIVSFKLNGTTYSAAVDASGKWSVQTAGADLAKETNIHATLVAHDSARNPGTIVADHPYSVDLKPPVATLEINNVTDDNTINGIESHIPQTISGKAGGEFTVGDVVSFKLNGVTYSTTVDASGDWAVVVQGSDLAQQTNIHATLVAHDAAGNPATVEADHAYSVVLTPGSTDLFIDRIAGDDIVNVVESTQPQTISGKVVGTFLAGDKVTFTLNGHDYSASVAADGKWSVSVPGSDLVADSTHNIVATVVAHDQAKNTNTVTVNRQYQLDLSPPDNATTKLEINNLTSDNVINGEEAKGNVTVGGKVTGEFTVGDVVSFKLDGTTYSATLDHDGKWSVDVPGSKLVADTGHKIDATLIAHDSAQNPGTIKASHDYKVDVVPPSDQTTQLSIDNVTSDNTVNNAESKGNVTISGKVTGEFTAGDKVSFTLDGTTYSATVGADGKWSVDVPGSKLVADTGHKIDATLIAHDSAQNPGTIKASHAYGVDVTPPDHTTTELLINNLTDDNAINDDESKGNVAVSGEVTGEFTVGDKVSFTLDGTTYSATVGTDGKWSVDVPGSKLVADTGHKIDATLIAHDDFGNPGTITASHGYKVDVVPPSDQTTQLSIDNVTSDNTVNNAESKGNVTISGKVTGEFTQGDMVTFKLAGITADGTIFDSTHSTSVGADGTWSVDVPGYQLVGNDGHKIDATLIAHDTVGNPGKITASHAYDVALNSISISSMSKDTAMDLAHASDFVTADGSAGRGVYGKVEQALSAGQKVQVSVDGGATWKDAVVNGLNWTVVDTSAHAANWTIQARIVENGVTQTEASKAVSFVTAGGAPTITSIPGSESTYTDAKAATGKDVNVSLAGTNAKAGDTLHIIWGDTTYDQVLTAADIAAGTATAKVPAQQTSTQGGKWDFGVTAQIVTVEGQMSVPSNAIQFHGQGWTTLAIDDLNRNVTSMQGSAGTSTIYQGGGVTITSNTTLFHAAAGTGNNAGLQFQNDGSASNQNYAQINFTQAVSDFSVRISALQNQQGGSRVVVYDTKGNVLSDQKVLADGTGGMTYSKLYSFTAPVGSDIGKVMIYGDGVDSSGSAGGGIVLDTLKFNQIHHAAGFNDTFTDIAIDTTGSTYKSVTGAASYYSTEGHFTLTMKGTVIPTNGAGWYNQSNMDGAYLYIGTGDSPMNNSAAIFTFDQPVQSFGYNLWGLETQSLVPGNGSWLEVYDTNDKLIFNRFVTNNGGTVWNYEQVAYTAPEGISIGKVIVYQDKNGTLLDNFYTVLAPDAPSGQKLIDHNWETFFDEASTSNAVVWYGQSFGTTAYSDDSSLANYHSDSGAFTITGTATKHASGNFWQNATAGSMYVADTKTAVVTFDAARSKIEVGATGIERGNTAILKVFDTKGTLLTTIDMVNPNGQYDIQTYTYEAAGNQIGRIEITGEAGGTHIMSISSSVTQVTTENDVVSMVIDPVAYFAQESAHIFGSNGMDTLKLTGKDQVLDLTTLTGDSGAAKISSIEKFDITGTGDNTLKISLNDVLHLGETDMFQKDGKVQVMVDGDAGDKVQLANLHDHGTAPGTWLNSGTTTIGGSTYQVYSYSNLDAEVLIKQAITASIV